MDAGAPGRANVVPKLAARAAAAATARPGTLLGLMPCGPVHLLTQAPHGVNRLPATCTSEGQSVMGEVPSTARESVPLKDHNDIVFRKLDVFPYIAIRSEICILKQNIYFYLNIDPNGFSLLVLTSSSPLFSLYPSSSYTLSPSYH